MTDMEIQSQSIVWSWRIPFVRIFWPGAWCGWSRNGDTYGFTLRNTAGGPWWRSWFRTIELRKFGRPPEPK